MYNAAMDIYVIPSHPHDPPRTINLLFENVKIGFIDSIASDLILKILPELVLVLLILLQIINSASRFAIILILYQSSKTFKTAT